MKKCKRKRRIRSRKNGKHPKGKAVRRKCGYDIVGASSDAEAQLFTPIIFQEKRGVRSTENNETIWLSETPSTVSKLEGASEFSIATLAQLNLAVDKKKNLKSIESLSQFGKFLWTLTKTVRRRNGPKTEWIDLFLVNAQLDSINSEIAMEQLEILLNYIERKQVNDNASSRVILKLGTNPQFSSDLTQLLGTKGYSNAIRAARNVNKAFGERDPTMIWSKGIESILSSRVRSDERSEEAIISAFLYNAN